MTQIIAHRGSRYNRPENTIAAFVEAIRVGVDGIELDVHRTRDGQLVVIHDESLDRTTNGSGLVRQHSLEDIKRLDAGSWFHPSYFREKVPTLGEVLDVLENQGFKGQLNIELKTNKYPYPKIEKQLATLMQTKARLFSYMYSSFNLLSLFLVQKYDPKVERAYLVKDRWFHLWLGQRMDFVQAIHIHKNTLLSPRLLQSVSKPLRLWTVNKKSDIDQAFLANVVGLITDYPKRALQRREKLKRG